MTSKQYLRRDHQRWRCARATLRIFPILIVVSLLGLACSRENGDDSGVSQVPILSDTADPSGDGTGVLTWQVSFLTSQPLAYPYDARNTFVAGSDFTAELIFSQIVDEETFDRALRNGLRNTGGDPASTWENRRTVLFDVRGCSGRVQVSFDALATKAGLTAPEPLVVYCGDPQNVMNWSTDRGTAIVGTIPANFTPTPAATHQSAVFYHRMRADDGGTDAGIWLAEFNDRSPKPLTVHYLGATLETAFLDGPSLVISTGGDDLQLFGGDGIRVRKYDPDDLGLVVGLAVDDGRGRIAVFEGKTDSTGRSGETRILLLDRDFNTITTIDGAGRLSRLSGKWRTVDAVWLDPDTIAFIHWNNRFYGVVAIANITSRVVTKTEIVADQLAGALADHRFVVRRQAGGRAGCWRAEGPDGVDSTPLCERLPGPDHVEVSHDGNLVAFRIPSTSDVVVWNRVTRQRRNIGTGDVAGWTPEGELIWVSARESFAGEVGGFQ